MPQTYIITRWSVVSIFLLIAISYLQGAAGICYADQDCIELSRPYCNNITGVCVQCRDNVDCQANGGNTPFCQFNSNQDGWPQCVTCIVDEDCRTDSNCNSTCSSNGSCNSGGLVCGSPLYCNETVGACTCSTNVDCIQDKSKPYCSLSRGHCVQCRTDGNCPSGLRCHPTERQCVKCTQDSQCKNDTQCGSICDFKTSTCVASGPNCIALPDELHCATNSSECVQCTTNQHCAMRENGLNYCDLMTNTCVECLSDDSQCKGSNHGPFCDTATFACVQCHSNENCTDSTFGSFCDSTKKCVECINKDEQCTMSGAASRGRPFCNELTHNCVECLTSEAECRNSTHGLRPYCDVDTQQCFECVVESHCRSNMDCNATCFAGQCSPGGLLCGNCNVELGSCQCYADNDCIDPALPYCSYLTTPPSCVRCTTNFHCRNRSQCDAFCGNNTCVLPAIPLTCPFTCERTNGSCGCAQHSDCPLSMPFCNLAKSPKVCVDCLANENCSRYQYAKICDVARHVCIECNSENDCSNSTHGPYCSNGKCVECLTTSDCAAYSDCNATCVNNFCTPKECSCDNDYNCTTVEQPFCNNATRKCVECSNDDHCERNNLHTCQSRCNSANTCTSCTCEESADCLDPVYPICATYYATSDHFCSQCTNNAHCPTTQFPYCNVSSFTCVECIGDFNCPGELPVCDMVLGVCTDCPPDSHCPILPTTADFIIEEDINQLSGGAIAGIVISNLVVVGGAAVVAWLFFQKRKKQQQEEIAKASLEYKKDSSVTPHWKKSSGNLSQSINSPVLSTPRSPRAPLSPRWMNRSKSSMMDSASFLQMSPNIYLRNIEIEQPLGRGRFGEVYMGKWNGSTRVALKKLKRGTTRELENELILLMKLNHPNIVRCLGIFRDDSECYLVMEYLSKGSVSDFLSRAEIQNSLSQMDILYMVLDVAAAMMHLEQKNIIHRDLGARNLLVSEADGRYVIKVADLGLSREIQEDLYQASDNMFPVKWSPPEVLQRRQFSIKSDVWSFGVCMWELYEYGKIPYALMSNQEALEHVLKGHRLPKPPNCPDEVYILMLACWHEDPGKRPTFRMIYHLLSQFSDEYLKEETELKEIKSANEADNVYNNVEDNVYNN